MCHCLLAIELERRLARQRLRLGEYLLEVSRYLHLNPVRGVGSAGQGTPMERRKRLRECESTAGAAGVTRG
jgi:hypothetical protein